MTCHPGTVREAPAWAEVFQRGRAVMPFDPKTTHLFKPLDDGGTQVVIANDPADQTQITLAQRHLRVEAAKFARGDLTDPATIHGQDMPGLVTLEQAAVRGTVSVRYQALANGALLRYATRDRGHPGRAARLVRRPDLRPRQPRRGLDDPGNHARPKETLMADLPPDREFTGIPRWVKVFGIIAIVLAVLVVIMLLAGGGRHGPGRHTSSSGAGSHGAPVSGHQNRGDVGGPAAADEAARTVKVTALDTTKFEPSRINVSAGEAVTFVVTNTGMRGQVVVT